MVDRPMVALSACVAAAVVHNELQLHGCMDKDNEAELQN